jgi:hydrogenase maturation protease
METIILGLGNELLGDEGVGVHAARLLQKEKLPEMTRIVEVGTAILDALPEFEHAGRIIVLDAMKDGRPPGTVYKIPLDECSGSACIASMHGFDIFRVMALAERSDLPPIMVFGMEPDDLGWSMTVSATVARSLPYLIEAVLEELRDVERRKECTTPVSGFLSSQSAD